MTSHASHVYMRLVSRDNPLASLCVQPSVLTRLALGVGNCSLHLACLVKGGLHLAMFLHYVCIFWKC